MICVIKLDDIYNNLSSDHSLNIRRSSCFRCTYGQSVSQYKPLQNINFRKVGNMQIFFVNNTNLLLTRSQDKKFEDMFLIKIASTLTTLSESSVE